MLEDQKLLPLLSNRLLDTCFLNSQLQGSELFIQGALSLGAFLEATYRAKSGSVKDFDLHEYAKLIIAVFDDSGAKISLGSVTTNSVSFNNRVCPFRTRSCHGTGACDIASAILGCIAARNFEHARVKLDTKTIAGREQCSFVVFINEQHTHGTSGDVYRLVNGTVKLQRQSDRLNIESQDDSHIQTDNLIIASIQMQHVMRTVETVAPTSATVLINGETGVGKGCIATALHQLSDRAQRTFLPVNCGAIPDGLVESALFGHERGAFTGAHQLHQGFFERAGDGTLFLDEIDALSISTQTRLLRVLQEGIYERVGGRQQLSRV